MDLDGDEDNISSVFIHNYDGTVVGLIPTQRCDELFNTQHFREFSRTHSSLSTLLSTEVSAERRDFPLNYSSVKFPLRKKCDPSR